MSQLGNRGTGLEFVYIGDPMCSWCWGFAPALEELERAFRIPIRTVVGGLRPGPNAEKLDDRMRRFLAHHWHQVEQRSGQPFDHTFLRRDDGWRYDTELPAIAVTTMRTLAPDATLQFFTRLQRAFYAERVDITDPAVYPDLIVEYPVEQDDFVIRLGSDEQRRLAWSDFSEARALGVSGFPALLLDEGDRIVVVSRGWAPPQAITEGVRSYLEREHAGVVAGLVCELGGEPC